MIWKAQLPPVSTSGCSDLGTGSARSLPPQGQGSQNSRRLGNNKEGGMMSKCLATPGSLGLGKACSGQPSHLQRAGCDNSSLCVSGAVFSSLCTISLSSAQRCYVVSAIITPIFQMRKQVCSLPQLVSLRASLKPKRSGTGGRPVTTMLYCLSSPVDFNSSSHISLETSTVGTSKGRLGFSFLSSLVSMVRPVLLCLPELLPSGE